MSSQPDLGLPAPMPGEAMKAIAQDVARQVEAAEEARAQVRECMAGLPASALGPAVLEGLVFVRAHLDRLEESLSQIVTARGRMQVALLAAQAGVEVAESQAKVRFDEYTSAREKAAALTAATLSERMRAGAVERAKVAVDVGYQLVSSWHRGAEASRSDLLARLRAVSFESTLDRSYAAPSPSSSSSRWERV